MAKGYVPYHLPEGEDLYYLSWCHGLAGKNRLYYILYDITEDENYLEFSKKMTQNMIYRSKHEDNNMKWVHTENRVNPN